MKNLDYYLSLKYPIELIETEEGFVASHSDLPGCRSFGDTATEAIEGLAEVRALWLEGYYNAHEEAPEPKEEDEYSGKFVLRLPRWLHRTLEKSAKRQGVSLNQFVVSLLAKGGSVTEVESVYQGLCERLDRIVTGVAALVSSAPAFSMELPEESAKHPAYAFPALFKLQHRAFRRTTHRAAALAALAQDEEVLQVVNAKLPIRFDSQIESFVKKP